MTDHPDMSPEEIREDRIASAYCWAIADVQKAHDVLRTGLPHRPGGVETLREAAASLNRYLAELEGSGS